MTVGCLSSSRERQRVQKSVVLDLPSESREKTSSRKPRKIAMRRRAQHMYSLPSQTMETKLGLRMVARQSRHTTWLLSAQPDPRPLGTTGAIGIRIIAFSMLSHAKPYMRANGSPIAKLERKLSSTHHHQATPGGRSHDFACAVARLHARLLFSPPPNASCRRCGCAGLECLIRLCAR